MDVMIAGRKLKITTGNREHREIRNKDNGRGYEDKVGSYDRRGAQEVGRRDDSNRQSDRDFQRQRGCWQTKRRKQKENYEDDRGDRRRVRQDGEGGRSNGDDRRADGDRNQDRDKESDYYRTRGDQNNRIDSGEVSRNDEQRKRGVGRRQR